MQRLQTGDGKRAEGRLAPLRTLLYKARSKVGVWLSLVEHCVRDAGVAGSNPATPTILPAPVEIPAARPAQRAVRRVWPRGGGGGPKGRPQGRPPDCRG